MSSIHRRQILSYTCAIGASPSFLFPSSSLAFNAETTKPKIRIGQIGVGHAHASKLSVYRESPDYEVVGLVEPDEKRRREAEEKPPFRGLPWMSRDELLATPGLQAVLVETQVEELLANAEACLAVGKHIHLDKPAGSSLPHFRRILALAEEQQCMVQLGYMYRYNPAVLLLRDFLRQGWLGEIFEIHTVMSKVVSAEDRLELAKFPGGILFELGGHIIDLVVGLMGKPTQVVPFTRRTASRSDSLADNMLAVFEYPQAIATIKSTAIEVEGGARRHLVVCGTEGTFHIQPLDNPCARIALSKPRGDYKKGYQDVTFPRFTRYVLDAVDMASVIRGEKANDFSYEHDLSVQTALLQACQMPLD